MSTEALVPIYQPALDRGLSIIPIPPREKGCKLENWPALARNSADIMLGFEDHNYGVVADEKFCILDIDDLEKFRAEIALPLPKTYTVKTSRGAHLYFRHTDKSREFGNRSGAGLFDFQAFNKYVVGEGSTHPSGKLYECVDSADITVIPDRLIDELDRYVRVRKAVLKAQGKRSGDRSDVLTYAGTIFTAKMKDEDDPTSMLDLLRKYNEAECEVPLSEGDLRRMVDSAFKKWEPKGESPTVLIGTPKLDGADENCTGFDYVVGPNPSSDDPDNFEGWFPLGAVSVVFGASGAGKTTWTLQMLKAQERGGEFLKHATFRLPWIMAMQDRDDLALKRTFRRMQIDPSDGHFRSLPEDSHKLDPAMVIETLYKAETVKPRIIFIEGIDIWVSQGHKAETWIPVLKGLQPLARRYNFALIGTMGSPKRKKDEGYESPRDSAFGSQVVARMVETMVHVVEDYEDGSRHITVMPRNAGQERFHSRIVRGVMRTAGIDSGIPTVITPTKAQGRKEAFMEWWAPGATWDQAKGTFGEDFKESTFYTWSREAKKRPIN